MKLSSNSWHTAFHDASYPNLMIGDNFCNYFWELVIAMVLFPLSWPFYVRKDTTGATFIIKVILGGAIQGIIGGLIYLVCTRTVEDFLIIGFWILLVVLIIAIVCFFIWFFNESETSKTINKNLGELGDIIKEGVVSTKERYCPKIDWN